jgi:hypothetical protein
LLGIRKLLMLAQDHIKRDLPWSLLITLYAGTLRDVKEQQAGIVLCRLCPFQKLLASKVRERSGIGNRETTLLESLLNNHVKEIKRVAMAAKIALTIKDEFPTKVG